MDALGFTGKPPGETGRVVDFSIGLGQRLTRLVREDLGEVGLGFPDERVPFQEPLRSLAGVAFLVLLEGGVCSFYS